MNDTLGWFRRLADDYAEALTAEALNVAEAVTGEPPVPDGEPFARQVLLERLAQRMRAVLAVSAADTPSVSQGQAERKTPVASGMPPAAWPSAGHQAWLLESRKIRRLTVWETGALERYFREPNWWEGQ